MSSTITTADKFVRSEDFASRLDNVFLPNEAWAVFAQLEQPATPAQIAQQAELPLDEVLTALNTLVEHKLIRKQLLSWRDFLAQKQGDSGHTGGATTSAPKTAPVAEATAAGRPGAALAGWPKPSAPPVPTESAPTEEVPPVSAERNPPATDEQPARPADPPPIAATLAAAVEPAAAEPPASVVPDPVAAPEPPSARVIMPPATPEPPPVFSDFPSPPKTARAEAPAPAPAAATTEATAPAAETVLPVTFSIANEQARFERRAATAMTISFRITPAPKAEQTTWKLRPLLKAIEQKGGGGLPGQLLVYRVFIHVPAEMMHAAGIQSLSLVDDNVVVRDRAFYDALCQAAHAVASLDLRTVAA